MTYHFSVADFSLTGNLRFLVATARGPEVFKAQLRSWADAVDTADDEAWSLASLQSTCQALVVLAHANAAFSRQTVVPEQRGSRQLRVIDRGGYSAAMEIMLAIVDYAPLCDDCRIKLMQSVADLIVAQKKQLDRLIPIH